ncbi:MAG: hypothetical protein GY909_17660 [Oligoflexia bacterium]|nr:hypothetical protein [Oligoflexia bacterium]
MKIVSLVSLSIFLGVVIYQILKSGDKDLEEYRNAQEKFQNRYSHFEENSKKPELGENNLNRRKYEHAHVVLDVNSECERVIEGTIEEDYIDVEYQKYKNSERIISIYKEIASYILKVRKETQKDIDMENLVYEDLTYLKETCHPQRWGMFVDTLIDASIKYNWKNSQKRKLLSAILRFFRANLEFEFNIQHAWRIQFMLEKIEREKLLEGTKELHLLVKKFMSSYQLFQDTYAEGSPGNRTLDRKIIIEEYEARKDWHIEIKNELDKVIILNNL